MHKAFTRREEDSSTGASMTLPSSKFFSVHSNLSLPLRPLPMKPIWHNKYPSRKNRAEATSSSCTHSHQQPHSAAGISQLLTYLQAITVLLSKTKIHSPSKPPFAPIKTQPLSKALSCNSKQDDVAVREHVLNDRTYEHRSQVSQVL